MRELATRLLKYIVLATCLAHGVMHGLEGNHYVIKSTYSFGTEDLYIEPPEDIDDVFEIPATASSIPQPAATSPTPMGHVLKFDSTSSPYSQQSCAVPTTSSATSHHWGHPNVGPYVHTNFDPSHSKHAELEQRAYEMERYIKMQQARADELWRQRCTYLRQQGYDLAWCAPAARYVETRCRVINFLNTNPKRLTI